MDRTRVLKRINALLAAIVFLCVSTGVKATASVPDVDALGAAVIDASGKVLFAENAHVKLPMASTTKIMTALIVLEHCDPSETVKVADTAYGVEGSSIYLKSGENISVEDLLYGLMLSSGNDAAVALACHVAGSTQVFADMMNKKAQLIGANNTNFVTPNGLHDSDHYTTAYDLALISVYAMRNELFREIVSTTYHRANTGESARTFKNKNRVLWEYEGGIGIKTGFTKAAGRCLVFCAQRDGFEATGVVLGCPDMFGAAYDLLDYAFKNYESVKVVKKDDVIARVTVKNGYKKLLELACAEDIIVTVEKGTSSSLKTDVDIPGTVSAPVNTGSIYGKLRLFDGTREVGSCALIASESIASRSYAHYLYDLFSRWTA